MVQLRTTRMKYQKYYRFLNESYFYNALSSLPYRATPNDEIID